MRMTTSELAEGEMRVARQVEDESAAAARRLYRSPVLRRLGDAQSLLEVLGPAQANYGGP